MALLQKLKEKLGFGSAPVEREETDAEVTVERESQPEPEPDEELDDETVDDEAVDDETVDDEAVDDEAVDEEPDDEPVATETEAAASTESLVDDEAAEEPSEAAEPAEAAGIAEEEIAVDDDEVTGASVEELTGIGPAYAERLAEIGIETVADLAAADAEVVAEGTSVGEKRAATWIDRATEF